MHAIQYKMNKLLHRIDLLEKRIEVLESKNQDSVSTSLKRVKDDLLKKNIYSASFIKVVGNYYEESLEYRASLLKCATNQLCKSIILENTSCDHENISDVSNSRFYCVILQYESKLLKFAWYMCIWLYY